MSKSHSSLRSVSVLSLCSVGQLLLQFAFQLLLAKHFGTDAEMDTYRAALGFPIFASSVLVGALGYAFVPVFVDTRQNSGEAAAWLMASNVATVLILVCTLIAAVSLSVARPLMTMLQPGFSAGKIDLTIQLFQFLSWLLLTNSMSSFLRAVHHCHGRFAITGIAPVVGMVITVVYTVCAYRVQGIRAVAMAVLLGSIVGVIVQLPFFLSHFRWRFDFNAAARRCLWLMAPLVAGAAFYNLDPLVDRYLASRGPTGSLSLLGYTDQLKAAIVTAGITAFAFVVFPKFSEHAASTDRDKLQQEVASAFRFLAFVMVPIVVALFFFSEPVVRDLLQRGKFNHDDTSMVAHLLVIYLGAIVAGSTGEIAARIFYASKDTLTPVVIGICGFTLGLGLKFWLAPQVGLVGIVAATSIYYLFNILCMLLLLARRMGRSIFSGVLLSVCRAFVGSAVAALVGHLLIKTDIRYSSVIAAGLGLVSYLVVMHSLRDEFARRASRFVILVLNSKSR